MISILAPSKTLDFSPAASWIEGTDPLFIEEATKITSALRKMEPGELADLMQVSMTIADTNYARIAQWGNVRKPALWTYRGDVYKGMYADNLSKTDAQWAEKHLRIMSGMYGVLRPHDLISPYRLEMKAKLNVANAKNLYEFWGKRLAEYVDSESDGIICNLSSEEYAKPVTKYAQSRVITPVFMDHKPNGTVGPVPIYSKMMRGVMARWIIDTHTDDSADLVKFTRFDYAYDAARSTPDAPVFIRETMTPLVFL